MDRKADELKASARPRGRERGGKQRLMALHADVIKTDTELAICTPGDNPDDVRTQLGYLNQTHGPLVRRTA